MRYVPLLLLVIITSYSYSMEEDLAKKSEEYQAVRAKANPLLAVRFDQFDKKWNQLQKRASANKNAQITVQLSNLALWGIKNLLPSELAYHIAYYRLSQDISCALCPNDMIKLIFPAAFRGKIIPSLMKGDHLFNRDSISQNYVTLLRGDIRLENGNYYRPRFQLERGPATGKFIFSDHYKDTYFYLGGNKEQHINRLFFDGPNKKESVLIASTTEKNEGSNTSLGSKIICAKVGHKFHYYRSREMPEISTCALHNRDDRCAIADIQKNVHLFTLKEHKQKLKLKNLISLVKERGKERTKQWSFIDHIEIYSEYIFKKLCFITPKTLLGLTRGGELVTIALPKARKNHPVHIVGKKCIFEQHFFINKNNMRIPLFIQDFAANTDSQHQVIMLANTQEKHGEEQEGLVLYVNLKEPGRFAGIENDTKSIENVFFSGNKIGFLEKAEHSKEMNIQEVCFIPYQQGLRLLYPDFFAEQKADTNKKKHRSKKEQ